MKLLDNKIFEIIRDKARKAQYDDISLNNSLIIISKGKIERLA